MSGKVVGWAMEQVTGSPTTKLVLIKLADNANEQGICWPSISLMVEHTELAERSVREHLKRLEEMDLIRVERRTSGGVKLANIYHLNVGGTVRAKVVQEAHHGGGAGAAVPMQVVQEPPAAPAGGVVQVLPFYIEEPSIEPSENRHSLAEREKDGSPSAEDEGPPIAGPDPKAWTPAIMAAYRRIPNPGGVGIEDQAQRRWDSIPWRERPTADEMISCIEARERQVVAGNAHRPPTKPEMVPHLHNWIKDRGFSEFLSGVRATREAGVSAKRAKKPTAILPGEIVQRLRDAGFDAANIDGWFGGATFEPGPPPRWTVPMVIQQTRLSEGEFGRRMRRAFGDEIVIDVVRLAAS